MRFQISIRLTELVIAEPAAPVGRQGGGVYGFQHQMPLGVDEGTFALGVGTPKEENEVFFFLGNDFDEEDVQKIEMRNHMNDYLEIASELFPDLNKLRIAKAI